MRRASTLYAVIVLALDTATPAVTSGVVALDGDGARELAGTATVDPRAHAELLTGQIRADLQACSMTADDVSAVVVGCGPGPFTGLRVGMATAAAYADALGVQCHPVVTLDAVARAALARLAAAGEQVGELLVATDARRREAYWARYAADGTRLDGPHVGPAADIPAPDPAAGGPALACGAEVRLAELDPAWTVRAELPEHPTAATLVACAAAALEAGAEPAALEPLYLRRPDAVPPRPHQVSPALVRPDQKAGERR